MYEINSLMRCLDLWDCSIGKPEIHDNMIRVPARDFRVYKEFPGFQHQTIFKNGFLIFGGVQSSKRMITEYSNPEGTEFKPSYVIEDGPFPPTSGKKYLFELGIFSYDPYGQVDWDMIAETVEVEGGEMLEIIED